MTSQFRRLNAQLFFFGRVNGFVSSESQELDRLYLQGLAMEYGKSYRMPRRYTVQLNAKNDNNYCRDNTASFQRLISVALHIR